jgi:Anaphase-promoting complex subunit 4 WD40 domain
MGRGDRSHSHSNRLAGTLIHFVPLVCAPRLPPHTQSAACWGAVASSSAADGIYHATLAAHGNVCTCRQPDGKALAVGQEDGCLCLLDAENGEVTHKRQMATGALCALCTLSWVEERDAGKDGGGGHAPAWPLRATCFFRGPPTPLPPTGAPPIQVQPCDGQMEPCIARGRNPLKHGMACANMVLLN